MKILANIFRDEIQRLANPKKGKWPDGIVRHHPSIGVEVEFPFDCAGCAMKTLQILFRLFQHTSRQLALACLRYVSVEGSFYWLTLLCHHFEG